MSYPLYKINALEEKVDLSRAFEITRRSPGCMQAMNELQALMSQIGPLICLRTLGFEASNPSLKDVIYGHCNVERIDWGSNRKKPILVFHCHFLNAKGETKTFHRQPDILVFYKKTAKNEKVLPYLMRVEKVYWDKYTEAVEEAGDAQGTTAKGVKLDFSSIRKKIREEIVLRCMTGEVSYAVYESDQKSKVEAEEA